MSAERLDDDAPVDPDDEILVAYLDGELSRGERSELEDRLLEDDSLRLRLQQLQRGWELLGEMDGPVPNRSLVESTLELAVAEVVPRPSRPSGSGLSPYLWPLGILAACVVGIGATFAAASIWQTRQYERQLRDLAIVENLDAYLHGSDLQLMRELAANRQWQSMLEASREINNQTETTIDKITQLSSIPVAEREAMIGELPLDKRAELKSRWERFKLLAPDARDQVRQTAETVAQQTDADQLLRTMSSYALWIESIATELREKIDSDDPAVRREAIATAIQQTQIGIAERSSYMLQEDTVERIYFVLRQIVRKRVDEGDQEIKEVFERIESFVGKENAIDTALAATVLGSEELLGGYQPERLSESELDSIRLFLSAEELESLAAIGGGDAMAESITLEIWAAEAVRRRYRRAESTTPLERYQAMNPSDRDVLDLLPPQQMLEQLTE